LTFAAILLHNCARDGHFRPSPRIEIPASISQLRNTMRTTSRIAIFVILLSAGCSSQTPTDGEPAPDVAFKHDEPGMAVELNSKDGLKLPEGFPADVAAPGQAKLISAMNLDKADVYTFETAAGQSVQQVFESIQAKMLSDGWRDMASSSGEAGASLAFKKDARLATYSISKQQAVVAVMLNLSK
jgi:hypothetical protein